MPNDLALAVLTTSIWRNSLRAAYSGSWQPAQEMGRVATNLRLDRIARGEVSKDGNGLFFPVEIVLRRSCGCKNRTPVVIHSVEWGKPGFGIAPIHRLRNAVVTAGVSRVRVKSASMIVSSNCHSEEKCATNGSLSFLEA